MIIEIEDETRDFLTTYKKDFLPRRADRSKEYRPTFNYPPPLNILNGPYMTCLNTRRKNDTLPLAQQTEDAQKCLDRIRGQYPRFEKMLPKIVPNEELIEQTLQETTATTYQITHLKKFGIEFSKKKRRPILPENWIISETIQRKSYKNPWQTGMENIIANKIPKPTGNLKPNLKERDILRIRTGSSEYESTINTTGNVIAQRNVLKNSFPSNYRARNNDFKLNCSEILAPKYLMLPSKIF